MVSKIEESTAADVSSPLDATTIGMCERDAKITFESTQLGERQTIQLSFNNTTDEHVSWRAIALDKAWVRRPGDQRKIAASALNVFSLTPSSGVILPGHTAGQTIQVFYRSEIHINDFESLKYF
jgi:cytochrome c oxidase assembly protein Cox11